jgi:predicted nucleic acid-binding protein
MSEVYLLDTNIISALGDPANAAREAAAERLREVGEQFVVLPTMAVAEIEFGMAKAPNIQPAKRKELREFIACFAQLPFDRHCVTPYALVRAEIWRTYATRKSNKTHLHKERRPEDLIDKVTGTELGIDEPDLLIASVAMAHNFILVTNDQNAGMERVKQAADAIACQGAFPTPLRTENWLR